MLHISDLEDNIAEYIARRLPTANMDVMFDVGSNIGWFTQQFLRSFRQCQCYLFEPVSVIFSKLQENLETFSDLNPFPRTRCFRLALGLTPTLARITATPDVTVNRIVGNDFGDTPTELVEVI